MDRQKHAAVLNHPLVTLGFVFRQSHPDQRSDEPADNSSGPDATEGAHDRTSRDEWSKSGNRQRADARQPAECSTDYRASGRTGGRTFRRLGALLVREFLVALVVR